MGGNLRTGEESAEKQRAQRGTKRKLRAGEGRERSVGVGGDGMVMPFL